MGQFPKWRATHTMIIAATRERIPVQKVFRQGDGTFSEFRDKINCPYFVNESGKILNTGRGRTVEPIPGVPPPVASSVDSHGSAVTGPAVLSELPSAGRPVVTLSATAAACAFMAASHPEWHCPHGMATANTGDNARLVNWDRERNVKQVHVCSIDPKTHQQTVADVLIPESLSLELW